MNSSPDLDHFLSITLAMLRQGQIGKAMATIARAPPPWQGHARTLARMAYAQANAGLIAVSLSCARRAAAAPLLDADDCDLLGNAFTLVHQAPEAYAAFTRAVKLRPGDASLLCNQAATARFLGKFSEAEAIYERVLATMPTRWDAYRNRSELRRQTAQHNHVAELRSLLSQALPPDAEVQLSYALGKELEDLENWDEAFACYLRGARTRRAQMRYDLQDDLRTLELIAAGFDRDYCRSAMDAPASNDGPIFITGLPRTGSTLLERMLGRHAQIQPLGELQALPRAVIQAARALGPIVDKADLIAMTISVRPEAISQSYLDQVAPLRDGTPYFTDKLPTNALYLGPIARALPGAKIIHLRRKPFEACVAIFKSLFDEAYPFSYDLAEMGRYYLAHEKLMAHWHAMLGPRVVTVDYEDLVLAPEQTMRTLLAQLDLPFDASCLAPEKATVPVMTASASQVRDPVHHRSLRRSTHFRAWLAPLSEVLGDIA